MFWNFSHLEALNEHVKMEVCQIEITNNTPEFLKLIYLERLQKFLEQKVFFQNIMFEFRFFVTK